MEFTTKFLQITCLEVSIYRPQKPKSRSLLWILRAEKVQPSGRSLMGSQLHSSPSERPQLTSRDRQEKFVSDSF
jgi:hypothetical protein